MRKLLFIFVALAMNINIAHSYGVHEDHPYEFLITKHLYKFYQQYTISSLPIGLAGLEKTYLGVVKKSAFRIRNNYDLSDEHGWQATGITRILSVGMLYSWATDIDIYDTRGVRVAFIDGSFATLESARFDLYEYDETDQAILIGVAYADADFARFIIHAPDHHQIAELRRSLSENGWNVIVNDPAGIDDRLIRIFAGFVVDYQDKFLTQQKTKV